MSTTNPNLVLLLLWLVFVGLCHHSTLADSNNNVTEPERHNITILSDPVILKPSQTFVGELKMKIPKGPIAIYEYQIDVVNGKDKPVPISQAYLHHLVIVPHASDKEKKDQRDIFFIAGGAESRGTTPRAQFPNAFMTELGEDFFMANVHLLNFRAIHTDDTFRCLECPCRPEKYDENGTLKGIQDYPLSDCSDHLLIQSDNPSCHADTYKGGIRCCEDGDFCLDGQNKPQSFKETYKLRLKLEYANAVPENVPLKSTTCCDVTGNLTSQGRFEYDVPQLCKPDDDITKNKNCIHTLSTVQPLHDDPENERQIDIVEMFGHLHVGGIKVAAYKHDTNELLCESVAHYGEGGEAEIGNETGLITSMSICSFDHPKRLRTSDLIRVESQYDARKPHFGVMGLMVPMFVEVNEQEDEGENLSIEDETIETKPHKHPRGRTHPKDATDVSDDDDDASTILAKYGSMAIIVSLVGGIMLGVALTSAAFLFCKKKDEASPYKAVATSEVDKTMDSFSDYTDDPDSSYARDAPYSDNI